MFAASSASLTWSPGSGARSHADTAAAKTNAHAILLSCRISSLLADDTSKRGAGNARTVQLTRGTRLARFIVREETVMNEDILKGKWRQLKGEVKSQWGKLTDDDLDRVEGDAEKLIGRVQERYGYQRDEAKREVDDFFRRHPDTM